jgi:hypothetical protein
VISGLCQTTKRFVQTKEANKQFELWQPRRSARSKRLNAPSDGTKANGAKAHPEAEPCPALLQDLICICYANADRIAAGVHVLVVKVVPAGQAQADAPFVLDAGVCRRGY